MVALLAVTIVWGGDHPPGRDGLASTPGATCERRGPARRDRRRRSRAVRRSSARGRGRSEAPLADAVRARADEAGFALASLDPDGDRVRIAIATAKPGALLGWIAGLEADGILVDALGDHGNGDGTVAAQLTLKARAA